METLPVKLPHAISPGRKITPSVALKSILILTVAFSLLIGLSAFGSGGGGSKTGATSVGYKLSVSRNGNGTVTWTPAGTTFKPGTVVTLTATPGAGAQWKGWSGSIFGNFAVGGSPTITVTMNGNISLTANFR